MGKDIDNSVKNTVARIAKISPVEIKQYELYYDNEDFENIDTFISMIAETFKLKGLNTETFITRWIFHFGRGTEYGIDLFTSFCNIINAAYCGAYVVNQKQIEKCCGRSMVKLTTSIMEIASEALDKSYYSENVEDDPTHFMSKDAQVMSEAIKLRSSIPDDVKIVKEDFGSKDIIKTKVKNLTKYYISSKQEDKISSKLTGIAESAMNAMDKTEVTENYEVGVLEAILTEGKKYFNDKDKRSLISIIEQQIRIHNDAIKEDGVKDNEDLRNKIALELGELRKSEGKIAR
jgi:hypothetical protein